MNKSYSCTENISRFTSSHNREVLKVSKKNLQSCNYRKENECPLDGQ